MDFTPRPLAFSSPELKGLSERLLASHHANNYTGAVKRLNAIRAQLQALDFTGAPGFQLNGLKREELIARRRLGLGVLTFLPRGGSLVNQWAADHYQGSFSAWRDRWLAGSRSSGRAKGSAS